jgi:hypothetical protein
MSFSWHRALSISIGLALALSLTITELAEAQGTTQTAPEFEFPWDEDITPAFTSGPHVWTGATRSGLDFSTGSTNTAVLAMADGTVSFVGDETCRLPSGTLVNCNTVKITHDGGWETWYVHLSEFSSRLSQWRRGMVWRVKQGDWLGNEGSDGASNVHIHIELRRNGQPISWSEVPINGWTAHTNCDGYEQQRNQQRNSRQEAAPCLTTNYNGYLSNGDVQVVPQTGNSGYPQYRMTSENQVRGDAYLTQLPQTLVTKPGQTVTIRFTLQNIGSFDWMTDRRISLRRVAGEAPVRSDTQSLPVTIPQGQEITWELPLSPDKPQIYQSTWQMTEAGDAFGDPVIVVLHVLPEASADGLVGQLQALYDDARTNLERLYRENLDRFNEELERLKREAEERAREEAQRQVERLLCGVVPGTILLTIIPLFRVARGQRRSRRKNNDWS